MGGEAHVRRTCVHGGALSSLVLIGALGAGVSAREGATHVVAAVGSGDFSTIGKALAAADGDTILVRPGSYIESLIVDKGISLQGDGPVDAIVVDGGVDVTVRDNVIRGLVPVVAEPGIDIRGPDASALVTGNSVSGAGIGVCIADGAATTGPAAAGGRHCPRGRVAESTDPVICRPVGR